MTWRCQQFFLFSNNRPRVDQNQCSFPLQPDKSFCCRWPRRREVRNSNRVQIFHKPGDRRCITGAAQINVVLHNIRHRSASSLKNSPECLKGILRLCLDIRTDHVPVLIQRHLTAHENQISGSNSLSSLSGATHMILGSDKLHLHGESSVLRESEANKTFDNQAAILLICS